MCEEPVQNLHKNTGLIILLIPVDCTVATLKWESEVA